MFVHFNVYFSKVGDAAFKFLPETAEHEPHKNHAALQHCTLELFL
jgi:hypothetical protein